MKRILIAEDDPVFLDLLSTNLELFDERFKILKAENGKVAIDVLTKEQISLLVTDIKMPEVDGLSLLAYVNENYPLVPCFVMTAYETPEIWKKLPNDIRGFFRKPFSPDELGPAITKEFGQETLLGNMSGISVCSFMMMIEMEKKTCLLEVKLPDSRKGVFYFEKGVLYNAVSSNLKGEAAAISFVTRKRAKFKFRSLPKKKIVKLEEMIIKDLVRKAYNAKLKSSKKKTDKSATALLSLPGIFISSNEGDKGQMTVIHLSIVKMRMKLKFEPNFAVGDTLQVEFNIDDKPRSLISKNVTVSAIDGYNVDAEFQSKEHYDKLGPYLHFNGLDKQMW